ncbi:MAG TPA: acyltransferase [Acidimicrobiales bacterium]|nr:acyltransferase [Acidimicrobiales bacterium]
MTATLTPAGHPTAAAVAAATPAHRDRYVDFLRAFSLCVVMFGHWLMAVVVWSGDGSLHTSNILEVSPWARWLTWVFQILPVFFVVGGFSNTASWTAARRDGRSYGTWLGARLARLVRPVLAFTVVWTAGAVSLRIAGVAPSSLRAGAIAQPLWFLAIYVAVVAVAPAMARCGWVAVPVLGAAVAAVDAAAWAFGVPYVVWLNMALVWLFVHQLGVLWRQRGGTWSRRRGAVLALAGFAGLLCLTHLAGYPESMVGGVGEARSNMFPPSLAIVALAVWQFGLALSLRPVVDRWLARPRAWKAVVTANGLAMTLYLWHLTALTIVAVAVLPTGLFPQPGAGSASWWALRPLWIALLAVALVPLVLVFSRFETARIEPAKPAAWPAGVAALLVVVAMGFLARRGFVAPGMPLGLPLVPLAALGTAWWTLTRSGVATEATPSRSLP